MGKKYYAVKEGRAKGIFTSWDICRQQVHGYPGASYKSFATIEEAEAFLNIGSIGETINGEIQNTDTDTEAVAYVDGSYCTADGRFSCGVVFFWKGEEVRLSESFSDPALSLMQNVAGEIKGAEKAMQYALDHQIQSLTIYHDYEGIAKWCTGEWQAKKPGTQAYRNFYLHAQSSLAIAFVKVKGHSGDKYNDVADQLAKEALKVPAQ